MLVFDVTKMESFLNVERWLTEVKNSVSDPQLVFILVGNMKDKNRKLREVTYE